VGSGLFAIDAGDTDPVGVDGDGIGQGAQILMTQVGNVITGSAGGMDYFTITIDPTSGVVTFDQLKAIWHANTGDPNDRSTLTTSVASDIVVTATATDADGDSVSASLNLGANVFKVDDDGPTIVQDEIEEADMLVVDESELSTNATASFADNFTNAAVDFGADGPGSVSYALMLSAGSVGSGLFAIDASDTDPVGVDGDGIGQGAQILMTQVGNVITGSAGGMDYFTITIDPTSGVVTFDQLKAIWHANTGDPNDRSTLTTSVASDIVVTATAVDADGDSTSASLNLGAKVF
jgi:hypothetical protein